MSDIPRELDPDDAMARLRAMTGADEEGEHIDGDAILCAVLRRLGQTELADMFEEKSNQWWYA